jgi:hypothetical protein
MPHHEGLEQWIEIVSRQMAALSRTQARVLGLCSFGMVMMRSCGMRRVAVFLAALLGSKENTIRQRLPELCYDTPDKRRRGQHEVEITTCFGWLVQWGLSGWGSQERRLALALDATSSGQTFSVLAVSIVYRGCAIPVAWAIVRGNQAASWRWLEPPSLERVS